MRACQLVSELEVRPLSQWLVSHPKTTEADGDGIKRSSRDRNTASISAISLPANGPGEDYDQIRVKDASAREHIHTSNIHFHFASSVHISDCKRYF